MPFFPRERSSLKKSREDLNLSSTASVIGRISAFVSVCALPYAVPKSRPRSAYRSTRRN